MSTTRTNEMAVLDADRWERLCEQLGAAAPHESFLRITAAYQDPPRSYHNAWHIVDCLEQLDAFTRDSNPTLNRSTLGEIEAALWFHDAVYDPRAKDNEEQSVRFMETVWLPAGVPLAVVERIGQLILATKHQSTPNDRAASLVTDIDLSILGRAPDAFEVYDRAIREEYSWVPLPDYRQGRAKVLKHFLALDPLYQTPFFRTRFERPARANLERKIAELEA